MSEYSEDIRDVSDVVSSPHTKDETSESYQTTSEDVISNTVATTAEAGGQSEDGGGSSDEWTDAESCGNLKLMKVVPSLKQLATRQISASEAKG